MPIKESDRMNYYFTGWLIIGLLVVGLLRWSSMKKPLTISEEASVQMPMKTVASLIALVAIGTWAYFGLIETQNQHHTRLQLMESDVRDNTEYKSLCLIVLKGKRLAERDINVNVHVYVWKSRSRT
jgi:hypothetical protein